MTGRRRIITLFSLALMSAFGPLSIDLYLAALPRIGDDFSAADSTTQLTLSACMIGLAFGQLAIGPMSDRFGRRLPLLVGIGSYAVMSVLCAIAPNIEVMVLARFLQGFTGAAGLVIGRAIVRDLFEGREIARAFSLLMMIASIAPVAAPLLGGQLLLLMPWRGLFLVLAVLGLLLGLIAAVVLPESLPASHRHVGGARALGSAFATVIGDRVFAGTAVVQALTFAALFAYISLSSFVLQDEYGLSPTAYSAFFAANAVGLIVGNRINALALRVLTTMQVLTVGLSTMAAAIIGMNLAVHLDAGLLGLAVFLFSAVASLGMIFPNTTAISLLPHPNHAGTASALLGTIQFLSGAAAGPLASLGGASAVAMTTAMGVAVGLALLVHWLVVRPAYASPRDTLL